MPDNKKAPDWKQHQGKTIGKADNETRNKKKEAKKDEKVKILMLTDYRDEAKAGQEWETDAEKAEELVRLKRATYVK